MHKNSLVMSIILLALLTSCAIRPKSIIDNQALQSGVIKNIGVALVLGGGGSRGIAHVGAIEVLVEHNIPIDLIVGSSVGSAVGALYADDQDISKTKEILFKAKRKELLDFSFFELIRMFNSPTSPVRGQAYENFIFENLRSKYFSQLKIPLAIVTVDSKTGKALVITSGSIAPAVRASSAIPPVIAPVILQNHTLFDGGILEPVPVATAKLYKPKFIIAIDINNSPPETMPSNALELTYKAFWLSYYQLSRAQAALADVDIHPDLSGHGTFEDHRKEELYQKGRKAALAALPEIRLKLEKLGYRLKSTN